MKITYLPGGDSGAIVDWTGLNVGDTVKIVPNGECRYDYTDAQWAYIQRGGLCKVFAIEARANLVMPVNIEFFVGEEASSFSDSTRYWWIDVVEMYEVVERAA